jgi:hypothetical protein
MLIHVSRRVSEIRQCALPFGGISILCVGDLFQLKPVKAEWVFLGGGPGAHLWKDNFVIKELTHNQRQGGENEWSGALNTIRLGESGAPMDAAFQLLRTRISENRGGPASHGREWDAATHLFAKTHHQREYNEDRLQHLLMSGARCVTLYAGHGFVKPGGVIERLNIPATVLRDVPGETDNCGGLEFSIRC